jgi:effector-binding domain-containing protein
MAKFRVETIEARQAAVVRAEVPIEQLPDVFDRGFHAVMATVERQGAAVVGPPFGYYPSMPGATVEVVVGFPVSGAIEADGDVGPFELPGGRVITGVHVGAYERLEDTYRELVEWAEAEGLQLATGMWESYLSDPSAEPDPATWQTLISWPVR